jgi:hypothetical protein
MKKEITSTRRKYKDETAAQGWTQRICNKVQQIEVNQKKNLQLIGDENQQDNCTEVYLSQIALV